MRKNTSTCLRVRKVCCLCRSAQKELFAPSFCAFIAPYSRWELPQTLPVCGKELEESIFESWPSPFSPSRCAECLGVLHLGACGSRFIPLCSGTVPVRQRRGRNSPIPAGGINRHRQAAALPQLAAELQRLCRQPSSEQCPPMAGSIPILRSY